MSQPGFLYNKYVPSRIGVICKPGEFFYRFWSEKKVDSTLVYWANLGDGLSFINPFFSQIPVSTENSDFLYLKDLLKNSRNFFSPETGKDISYTYNFFRIRLRNRRSKMFDHFTSIILPLLLTK